MKTSCAVVALFTLSAHARALPRAVKRDSAVQPPVDDTAILNYALAIENLENAFYTQALAKFDEQAFNQSGYPPSTRAGYVTISQHEQAHVALISQTLGENTTQPCNYTFPYTDVPSFVNFSQILAGVGTSAYIGAIQNITNSTYLIPAASILATEARHAAWIASAVNNGSAWDGPFDTPLTPRQVITLATPYVSSCPSTNTVQLFTPFPALTVSPGLPGSVVTFTFNASGSPSSNATNSTSGDDGMNDPNASPSDSGNSTTADPGATPDGTGASNTTAPDGSGSGSGSDGSSDPSTTNPTTDDPSTTDPSTADPSTPSDSDPSSNDESDPSDSNNSPNLTTRQDSNSSIPDPNPSSNGTSPIPSANSTTLFAAFLSGLEAQFAPIGADGSVTLPSNLTGQVYAVVTTSDTVVTDDTIVAGPTVLMFNFNSQGNVTSKN